MDRSSPDDDKQNPPLMENAEEMEVTMTTQLENLLVTREDAIQTQAEETDGLPLVSRCENEDSNKSVHTDTSTSHLPEMNDHNLPSENEGKEVQVTTITHAEHVSVTRDDATPANTRTEAEEAGAVQTAASAVTLPVSFVCEAGCVDEESEDSDRCLHSHTHSAPQKHKILSISGLVSSDNTLLHFLS